MSDLIDRQAAIEGLKEYIDDTGIFNQDKWFVHGIKTAITHLKTLPSVQPEPLTDKEQRIFLAAMGREEKVCEEVDRNHIREPYEDSLMRVCKEIRRKVKGALWTR